MLNRVLKRLNRVLSLLKSLIPSMLPTTGDALDTFCADVIALGGWPDNDSFRHAIAAQLQHLGPETIMKPKIYFVRITQASIVKQNAYALMVELKEKQKQRAKEGQDGQQEAAKVNGAVGS